jgi:hypothetical protein
MDVDNMYCGDVIFCNTFTFIRATRECLLVTFKNLQKYKTHAWNKVNNGKIRLRMVETILTITLDNYFNLLKVQISICLKMNKLYYYFLARGCTRDIKPLSYFPTNLFDHYTIICIIICKEKQTDERVEMLISCVIKNSIISVRVNVLSGIIGLASSRLLQCLLQGRKKSGHVYVC